MDIQAHKDHQDLQESLEKQVQWEVQDHKDQLDLRDQLEQQVQEAPMDQ